MEGTETVELLGSLRDTSTGYTVTVERVNLASYDCEYRVTVTHPVTGEQVDGIETIPLRTDGTGAVLPI